MTSKDILDEKTACISDLIDTCEFEISEMQKILGLINSEKWDEVDFCLNLKNPEEWKSMITKFNFRDCVPEKYIVAIKKLVKMAFEEGIQIKENYIKSIKNM